MRLIPLVALLLFGIAGPVHAAKAHTVACCILIDIPDVTPGPVCRQINFNVRPRRLATKRFCRLLGGSVPVNGMCTCPQ